MNCFFEKLGEITFQNKPSAFPAMLKEVKKHVSGEITPLFGYKLETMPGISYVTAAALIAEVGDINLFTSAAKLAKYAGIAPVQYSSGQSEHNFSNRRGDRNLNDFSSWLCLSAMTMVAKAGR